jgi:lipoprotein-anchoring transpeptidase ErfK/SrfK
MLKRFLPLAATTIALLTVALPQAEAVPIDQADPSIAYRLERLSDLKGFGGPEIALLEKLNRADARHLPRLTQVVVPITWRTELEHSPFPAAFPAAQSAAKLIVVDQPAQAFAAYENGAQVKWGPISSGRQQKPTPSGLFFLNWRARSRISTLSGEWRLNWYFNFHNARGLAFHEFDLPGVPMSHACVRLLSRDAEWIYKWGQSWTLDPRGRIQTRGTPVLILGQYDFKAVPPWMTNRAISITLPAVLPEPGLIPPMPAADIKAR